MFFLITGWLHKQDSYEVSTGLLIELRRNNMGIRHYMYLPAEATALQEDHTSVYVIVVTS